jgi:trimeric autotransporter adhesin
MRKIFFFLLIFAISSANSQVPDLFKYQSVARNTGGQTLVNSPVGIRLSIVENSMTGNVIYTEEHSVITNDFGLFNLSVGGGSVVLGDFSTIDWGNSTKYLEIEADFAGGTNYSAMGTSQLLSVPYALYAKNSGNPLLPDGSEAGNTVFWDGNQWITNNSNLFNAGSFVGVGTTNPSQQLHVNGNITIPSDSAYMINNVAVVRTKGVDNTQLGQLAGANLTFGQSNLFAGTNSGFFNTVGSQNVFLGVEAGRGNLDGMMNSFLGRRAGYLNVNGDENTFVGAFSGQNNTSGDHNSFLGVTTGNSNTTGNENTFLGAHAGYYNTNGSFNTYIGNFAGQFTTSGTNNVFIGFNSDANLSTISNAIAIGSGSMITQSNSVVIGNSAMTSIGGQVGWSTFSDRRLKHNIQPESLGLDFILKLSPVRYKYTASEQQNKFYSGLIAQDVEAVLKELDVDFSGIDRPSNDSSYYSIRYGEFVIPLINAIQEQQQLIQELQEKNIMLTQSLERLILLEKRIISIENKK